MMRVLAAQRSALGPSACLRSRVARSRAARVAASSVSEAARVLAADLFGGAGSENHGAHTALLEQPREGHIGHRMSEVRGERP